MRLSPKILGLNDEIFGTVFEQFGTDFWTVCAVFYALLLEK